MSKVHVVKKVYAFYVCPIQASPKHAPVQAHSLNGNPIHPKMFIRMVRLPDRLVGDPAGAMDFAIDSTNILVGEVLLSTVEME